MASGTLRVVYLVSLFPCWSETFIVREIATLVAEGVDVRILSLKAPSEHFVQPDAERLLHRVRHPLALLPALLQRARASTSDPGLLASIAAEIVRGMRPWDAVRTLEALARGLEHLDWLREFDPDVIYAHWATFPSTVAWALARIMRKPFGFTCHAHDIFVNDHLLKEKIKAASVAVTISQFNVDWLGQNVTPLAKERFKIVHCGVDLATIPYRRDQRRPGELVAVGRLDPIKGFDVLIDALGDLASRGRRFRCRIIGSGPLEGALRERVTRRGVGDMVELTGALPHPDVRAALYEASMFVLPSVTTARGDRDGIPVALMEAMAAGAPCISTRVSGIPELIQDELEGLLVPERHPQALSRAIERLLDDATLADALATEARGKIERDFEASREARKLLELFVHVRS